MVAAVAVAESQREGAPGEVAVVDWAERDHSQRNGVDRVGGNLRINLELFGFYWDRVSRVGLGPLAG